jgi:hypothetical protein
VPRRAPYVPKHRAIRPIADRLPVGVPVAVAGAALCATGLAVSGGALPGAADSGADASATLASGQVRDTAPTTVDLSGAVDPARRTAAVSRSLERTAVDPAKKRVLDQRSGGQVTAREDLTGGDPRTVARALLPQFGFGQDQFSCLDSIYTNESGWNVRADNPSSSAYGIPQALPGSKMASAGADWQSNAATQIRWGLGYIKARYGSPCSAWGFKQSHGWY